MGKRELQLDYSIFKVVNIFVPGASFPSEAVGRRHNVTPEPYHKGFGVHKLLAIMIMYCRLEGVIFFRISEAFVSLSEPVA